MPRKGKTQKHTAAEIAAKIKASKEANGAAGGGGKMAQMRKNAGNKASISCDVCKGLQPSMASMKQHYESKHPKVNWTPEMEADYKERQQAARGKVKPKKVATHVGNSKGSKGGKDEVSAVVLCEWFEPLRSSDSFFVCAEKEKEDQEWKRRFVFLRRLRIQEEKEVSGAERTLQ